MKKIPARMVMRGAAVLFCVCAWAASARAEPVAHWKFEREAPFEDAVSRLHLNPEGKNTTGRNVFRVTGTRPLQLKDVSTGALLSPSATGVDLRLRVNAPTRGGNPFRLSQNSWTLSGWFLHMGAEPTAFGHVLAGTHGYSTIAGRGSAGWCLRVVKGEGDKHALAALFSSGGEEPVVFELKGSEAIATGADRWYHFALVWKHDGGAAGKGEAQLYVNGKPVGTAPAPANFDAAEADRNAFRGLWIAGRQTTAENDGSDNWAGRLDDFKLDSEPMGAEAILAEFKPAPAKKAPPVVAAKPEAPPAKPATVAKVEPPKPKPPPPPPPPAEKVLEMRTWTDSRGQTLEAALVQPAKPVPGRVLLETNDGIRISLSGEKLSAADQDYVRGK